MSPSITPYSIDLCFWNTPHFPLCFSLLFLAALLWFLPVTRSGTERSRCSFPIGYSITTIIRQILSRIDTENLIIESSSFFFFFFFNRRCAIYMHTRAIYTEPWLHNVGGILNLYVTQVPGVMKHGRCNVIKYYSAKPDLFHEAWNIFSHLRYIYIVIYEGTIGIWCQTIVIDIRNEARFWGARFCATFRMVELKKKIRKRRIYPPFFYILKSKIEILRFLSE